MIVMIKLIDVYKTYDNGTKALNGIDLEVDDGEFVFIVGPSGSGKSTITKLLIGEFKPTSGKVYVNDFDLTTIKNRQLPYMRRTVGVVFQDFRLIEEKTVFENVAFVMRAVGVSPRIIKKRVPYVLDLVGVLHKSRRHPNELSGGEQQRVAIARALVNNPSVIIADEPTGNLEPGPLAGIDDAAGQDQLAGHHCAGGDPRKRTGEPIWQTCGEHRPRPGRWRSHRRIL